jgi:hypothetical protein
MQIDTHNSAYHCNVEPDTYTVYHDDATDDTCVFTTFRSPDEKEHALLTMTADEARRYAEKLIIAANEIDPR